MKAWRIFFTGVGGQGTLLATRVLGEAALLTEIIRRQKPRRDFGTNAICAAAAGMV